MPSSSIIIDLRAIFELFPLLCLMHLRSSTHRLVRFAYTTEDGRGCIVNLLTELAPCGQIDSRSKLIDFFGGGDPDSEAYQPAFAIVRLWDQQVCSKITARYGANPRLDVETLISVLDAMIAERTAIAECAEKSTPREELSPASAVGLKRRKVQRSQPA